MSNSPLVSYTLLSPNCNKPRNHKIDTITIHCMAGNLSVETCGQLFYRPSRQASSNYGIGTDGRIGLYVEESNRAWTSANPANDHRAITIEVANDGGAPDWHVSDKAMASLINLCADICRRNDIKELVFSDSKEDRINHRNGANMTWHRDFANTACVPTYTEVLTRNGWISMKDIQIGDEIACADIDNLNISFEEVYNKVPIKKQDTYTNNELTATMDHRMIYRIQKNPSWHIQDYKHLLNSGNQIYIPLAGNSNFQGLPFSNEMEAFLMAVQADGHYMHETLKTGGERYYGLEFHLKKQRKIDRIKELLETLSLDYKENHKSDGSVSIRIYNQGGVSIVKDICEKYLNEKCFTWDWLNLSPEQADLFFDEIMFWDGCSAANKYTSKDRINLDIVNAIAALNNMGSRIIGDDVFFRDTPYITLSKENTHRNHDKANTEVTCVSVKTGIILIRQKGKTFIVGNCPAPYLMSKHPYIAAEVNKILNPPTALKGVCQMPNPNGAGFLLGIEANPSDKQYIGEISIYDCSQQAWIAGTGKCYLDNNALWWNWNPPYGYYWTLFRLYDGDEIVAEQCYGFQNI